MRIAMPMQAGDVPAEPSPETLWRADENCREMFRLLARGAGGAIEERGDHLLVATGVNNALFNPVFAPAGTDAVELAECARAFYGPRELPWALVGPEHAPPAPRRDLAAQGLYQGQIMPLLTHDIAPDADWPEGAPVTVRAVEDAGGLADHRAMLTACFGIPEEMARTAMPRVPAPLLRLYVAYEDGRAVGSGALCEAAGLAGIYNVGTPPAYRRRGIAVAVLRKLLADAADRGLGTCVLQSSNAGLPLYARLHFTRLSTYVVYMA